MKREVWTRQYRQGLLSLYAAKKLRVTKQDDGTLMVMPPEGNRGVMFDPSTGAWRSAVPAIREDGVGFISMARFLGLEFTDALAPYLSQEVG